MNEILNKKVFFSELYLTEYEKALNIQLQHFNAIVEAKIKNRNLGSCEKIVTDNYLFFCEHPSVYTLGKSGDPTHLLIDRKDLAKKNVSYFETGRGGDITYHGPGQLVVYPVLDLENFFTDIHKYMRLLEEAVIMTLKNYGIVAGRIAGLTGVWTEHESQENAKKICALGVRTSRWVAMHGFSFNINTDLSYFDNIVPCGIKDKMVTSMAVELGMMVNLPEVSARLLQNMAQLFGMEIVNKEENLMTSD